MLEPPAKKCKKNPWGAPRAMAESDWPKPDPRVVDGATILGELRAL